MRRPTFRYSPEQSLWSGCLYEAVQTYLGVGVVASSKERQEAREWFGTTFDESKAPPGSFEWTCQVLEINPARFRRSLLRIAEKTGGSGQAARTVLTGLRREISGRARHSSGSAA